MIWEAMGLTFSSLSAILDVRRGKPVPPVPQQRHYCGTGGATVVEAISEFGGMAEWTMATVLKTVVAARSPGVRIPLPPPDSVDPYLLLLDLAIQQEGSGSSDPLRAFVIC